MDKSESSIKNHPLTKGRFWALILGVILIGSNLRAPITAVGPLISTIRDDLGLSNAVAGSITTVPLLAFALLSPFAPKIAKKIGTEITIFLALLVLTIGIGTRLLPGLSFLFFGTVLVGFAIAICNVLLPGLIKNSFPLQMGLMTGIYGVFMNVFGALAAGISVPVSLIGNFGWRGALGFWGILSIIGLIIWSFQLTRKQEIKLKVRKPPYKSQSILKSPVAWNVTVFMGVQSLIFYTLMTWMPEILQSIGYSTSAAGWMLSLLQFAVIPMTFIIPIVAGKTQNQRVLAGLTAVLFFIGILGLIQGVWVPLWVVIIGIAGGSAFGLSMMFFSLRTKDGHQASELSGMAQSIGYLLAATGPIAFGWLHDVTGGWNAPLMLLLAMAVIIFVAGQGAGKGSVEERV